MTGLRADTGPVTAAHTARLAPIVREQLAVDPLVRVAIQQPALSGDPHTASFAFVSVPDLGYQPWVFMSPLLDLSPHELRSALALSLKGYTYVAIHS